jgi:hypothetical protein
VVGTERLFSKGLTVNLPLSSFISGPSESKFFSEFKVDPRRAKRVILTLLYWPCIRPLLTVDMVDFSRLGATSETIVSCFGLSTII